LIVTFDWQTAVVIICVVWAVGVLVWRGYCAFFKPSTGACGSGGCHDCPSNASAKPNDLVQLDASLTDRPLQKH
jgi:hypothetical protein